MAAQEEMDLKKKKKKGFIPCKAEQPLWGMGLQEKEAQKDYSL